VEHKLRLGTHSQLTGEFNTENRDSHRVPQFLFVEYFQNKASTPMFPKTGDRAERLPGFQATDEPGRVTVGARSIDYGALDPGSSRGGNVPAISLATRTHKTGRLHVGGSSTWPEDGDTFAHGASQSQQVHAVFRGYAMRRLRATGGPPGGSDIDADFREVADWARTAPDQGRVQEAVFSAMRDTYRWMYFDVMRPALDRALRTEEPRFYIAAMIEQNGPGALPATHDPYRDMGVTRTVMTQVDAMQHTGALAEFAR
jgi:hypothetical protein